jgi:hypothetical protein
MPVMVLIHHASRVVVPEELVTGAAVVVGPVPPALVAGAVEMSPGEEFRLLFMAEERHHFLHEVVLYSDRPEQVLQPHI